MNRKLRSEKPQIIRIDKLYRMIELEKECVLFRTSDQFQIRFKKTGPLFSVQPVPMATLHISAMEMRILLCEWLDDRLETTLSFLMILDGVEHVCEFSPYYHDEIEAYAALVKLLLG